MCVRVSVCVFVSVCVGEYKLRSLTGASAGEVSKAPVLPGPSAVFDREVCSKREKPSGNSARRGMKRAGTASRLFEEP